MTSNENKPYHKLHGIQLASVGVIELSIKANQLPNEDIDDQPSDLSIKSGHGEYDEDEKTIQVGLQLEYGMEDESDTPYSMRIELFGNFEIDEKNFNKQYISNWAKENAPFILFPFLREHAYALPIRCGFDPLILPLLHLPPLGR